MAGYILYKEFLGRVLILTTNSKNPKTGPMYQTWILDTVYNPLDAYKQGQDHEVCGKCKFSSRPNGGDGSCYVQIGFAPSNIWKTYQRKKYKHVEENELTELGKNQQIRLGAYGDPAFIPTYIWDKLLVKAAGWTGYTHQWKTCDPDIKKYCMASVDNESEADIAQAIGWRTFRVDGVHKNKPRYQREARCPASKEAGYKLQCINCPPKLKCNGIGNGKHNIVIRKH